MPHEDEVDAVAFHLDRLVVEHGENLSHDFSRRQVALQSQQSGHAEGTLDSAAYLAGNADGGALKGFPDRGVSFTLSPKRAKWHPRR